MRLLKSRFRDAGCTMAKQIYAAFTSLDGYVADETGNFDWAELDEEVHAFVNSRERRSGARRFAVCAVRDSHAVGNGSRRRPTRNPQEANQRRHVACDDRLRARVSGLVLLVVQPSTVCACDAARGGRCSFLSDGTNATPATAVNSSRWRKRASMTLETRGVCRVIPLATSGEASVEANGS